MNDKTHDQDSEHIENPYAAAYRRFPQVGAKLRFKQSHDYPYSDMAKNADRELTVGAVYTLKTIELASSWACITLEEKPGMEFSLGYFEALPATNKG